MTTDTEGYATCHLPPCHGFDAGTVRKFGYEDTSRQDMQWANADRADKGKAAADAFRAKLEGSSRVQSYVLRIRDRGHLTLVLWSSGRCSLPLPKAGEAGAAVSKRLFKHEYGMPPNWAATMAFAPALDQASETVTVTALPPDGKGGILYSDKELTEAPADGYLPSVSFAMLKKSTGHSAAATHFLYFRAAAPAVYGSIEISLSDARWKADRVEFPIAVKVNPYGGHTFEAIDWKFRPPVEKQALLSALQDKAGKALEEGHLAEEPNFRELLGLPDLK